MENELKAKNFYRPLDPKQLCLSTDEVGSVLDRIDEVHGALIALNEDNDFIGVLSSYKTLYKNHTPPGKKVVHSVTQPMLITKETALAEIANYMAAEKVYLLPVFENENIIGTIAAVDIVKRMLHDENLLLATAEELKIDSPFVLNINAKVKDAYKLLRQNSISEVVITDKLGKVCGAVTRADIKQAFIHPTDRQRFHKDNYRPDDVSFDEEKKRRKDDPIRNYLTELVPVIQNNKTAKELILALLESDPQYLIITDKASIPVGIISYRNVLEAIGEINAEEEINIIFDKPSQSVSPDEFSNAYHELVQFSHKMNQRIPIQRVEVRVQESKFTTNKTAEYEITLQINPYSGSQYVTYAKAKIYQQSLRSAMKLIEKQLHRDMVNFKKHRKTSLAESSREAIDRQLYR